MKKLIIMQGLPGSGKSTVARNLVNVHFRAGVIFSTDDFWIDKDGQYRFDGSRIKEAHQWNFNRFENEWLAKNVDYPAIIDNTNLSPMEWEKYTQIAEENNIPFEFIQPKTIWAWDVEECALRNTHNVPREAIQRMYDKAKNNNLIPSYVIAGYCCENRYRGFAEAYRGAQGVRVCEGCGRVVKNHA